MLSLDRLLFFMPMGVSVGVGGVQTCVCAMEGVGFFVPVEGFLCFALYFLDIGSA